MKYEETTIKSDRLYEGKILNLKLDTVEIPGKKYSKREIVEVSGASAIVPILEDGSVVMIKQYRKAIEKVTLEIPAGKIDPGEEPRETAERELKEETGYTPSNMTYLTETYTSPGFCNEKIHIFLAKGLEAGDQDLDDDEVVETLSYTFEDIFKLIERGDITDAKTIIGIFMARDYLKKERDK